MTKIKWDEINTPNSNQLYETIINHPYYSVGLKCVEKRKIKNPNILHLILEYYEIAKVDNKINRGVKK